MNWFPAGTRVEFAKARHAHRCGTVEAQGWALQRKLQPGRAFRVAQQTVADAKRNVVHRAGWRHADRPIALAPGPGLNGGVNACRQDLETARLVVDVRQRARVVLSVRKGVAGQRLAQIVSVGLNAECDGFCQRRIQTPAGQIAAG